MPITSLAHSQNFLESRSLVQELVRSSSITSRDVVLDIGAGRGIIAEALARVAKNVVAVEADPKLADGLRKRFADRPSVTIVQSDFLNWRLPSGRYKVFANIPFNVTADVLRRLLEAKPPPSDAYLILQREAAQKYAGLYSTGETLVSLLHKPWFEFQVIHRFRPTDFRPVPAVSIVLLRILQRATPLVAATERASYCDFVVHGFTATKPTLKKSFKAVFGHVQFLRLAQDLGFSPSASARTLSFEQWLSMYSYFRSSVDTQRQRAVSGAYERLQGQQSRLQKTHRTRSAPNWNQPKAR